MSLEAWRMESMFFNLSPIIFYCLFLKIATTNSRLSCPNKQLKEGKLFCKNVCSYFRSIVLITLVLQRNQPIPIAPNPCCWL